MTPLLMLLCLGLGALVYLLVAAWINGYLLGLGEDTWALALSATAVAMTWPISLVAIAGKRWARKRKARRAKPDPDPYVLTPPRPVMLPVARGGHIAIPVTSVRGNA